MIMKERLLSEMGTVAAETKWEEVLSETINEMFEVKPNNPYQYLQRKTSLKQKMDGSKTSQYLLQLSMYLSHLDPLNQSEKTVRDRIISLCVEKYQHVKIKKTQIVQVVSALLLAFEGAKRDHFLKLIEHMLDHQTYTILGYSQVLYFSVIYRSAVQELTRLDNKLGQVKLTLNKGLLLQYANTVNQKTSIIKAMGLQLQGEEGVFKLVANQIVQRIDL